MCCGSVTRRLYNTRSLIDVFSPRHRFSHSKLSKLTQDGQKSTFRCCQKHQAAPCQRVPGISGSGLSWPKKPVRPRKPKLPSSVEEIAEGDDEEDDDGEDNEGSG